MFVLVKHAVLGCGFVLTSLMGLMTSAGFTAAEPEGLTGILPTEIPVGLGEDDFAVLDGAWAEWSAAAAADVARLYSEEPLSLADQKAALDAVASRLRVMEKAIADPAYRKIHSPLTDLHGKLKRRYDIAVAALQTLELDPAAAKTAQIDRALQQVLTAAQELEVYVDRMQGGRPWLGYLGVEGLATKVAGKSASETLTLLDSVDAKFAAAEKLTAEQQAFLARAPFTALAQAIDQYRDSTLIEVSASNADALRDALAQLVTALEGYEQTRSKQDAGAARTAYANVCQLAADGGDLITAAMRTHYFNYNLHVVVSETFLSKLAYEERMEEGIVDDFVLGAKVDGNQSTLVTLTIDTLPSSDGLRFALVANGTIVSCTQGVTDQATVYTRGDHCFTTTKVVRFDGDAFTTQDAEIAVGANNNTYAASTSFDGIPILGGIGKMIAKSTARKKKPQSEAIARGRIADKVLPRFDEESNAEFAKVNTRLNDELYAGLRKGGIYPSARSFSSTENSLMINTRAMEAGELSGARTNGTAPAADAATIEVHESLLNNLFDRVGIAGKTLTEDQVSRLFADYFEMVFNRRFDSIENKDKQYEGDGTSLVFSAEDPLRVRFEGGAVMLTIRAGLKRQGEEDIPTQEINVPLTYRMEGDKIIAEAGDIGVSPVERPESIQLQLARAGVIRQKIAQALPRREIDTDVNLTNDETGKVTVLNVTDVSFLNGWLRVVLK